LLSHNRVIPMSVDDCFFITEASKSRIFEEWKIAQSYVKLNSPINRPPKSDQVDQTMSNGERVKMITTNRYSSPEVRPWKRTERPDFCKCDQNKKGRCGPSFDCLNRQLNLECPEGCGVPGKGCNNRSISEAKGCINVRIVYFPGKGYGAVASTTVQSGEFIGEYVGEIITNEDGKRRIERISNLKSNEAQYYIMELDSHRSIDAHWFGNEMRFVNHSCDPNCTAKTIMSERDTHLVLVAIRNIKRGEELSFDYNMYSSKSGREVPMCHCDSKNCTGILAAKRKNSVIPDGSSKTTGKTDPKIGQNSTRKIKKTAEQLISILDF